MVQRALGQLREYFAGQRREFALPLDLPPMEPSPRLYCCALSTVGYGKRSPTGELAELSGTGVPARAIGEIMAANPVPIIIPCHRVVASDGLGGYSGGGARSSAGNQAMAARERRRSTTGTRLIICHGKHG